MATPSDAISVPRRPRVKTRRAAPWLVLAFFLLPVLAVFLNGKLRQSRELQHRQRHFCERVEQQGGAVGHYSANNWLTNLPEWMRARIGRGLPGVQATQYVGSLHVMGPEFDDDDMPLIANFERLEELHFYATGVTNAGLANLSGLKELTVLVLDPQVSDAGLVHLSELTNLATLDLVGARIEGDGLRHLCGLSRLQNLYLTGTPLADPGLKAIAALRSLEKLNLSYTEVTDAGMVHLAQLKNLQQLDLAGTKVSDQAVQSLQRALPNVRIQLVEKIDFEQRP